MSWKNLVSKGTIQRHKTSRQEIEDLKKLVSRDLKDAEIDGLSDDRRFATAYNAVLQISKIAIACSGYRVSSTQTGHHRTTFEAVKYALQTPEAEQLTDYFEYVEEKETISIMIR